MRVSSAGWVMRCGGAVADGVIVVPPNCHYFHCDLGSSKAIEETAEKVKQHVGHPTVLVNNAG